MSSSELFPQRVPQEAPFFGPEITTQQLYVQELSAHAETIPDLSRLKPYDGLTFEASQLLGNYCTDSEYSTEGLVEKGVTPLYREDIIDPYFCKSVSSLTMKAAGQKDSGAHWYAPIRRDVPAFGYGRDSREAQWASRQWERFYIGYMRQRRFFHVAFMQTLVDKTPIDPLVQVIGLENGKPVQIPNAGLNGNKQTDPALLYDKTNWLTASLLSALCLPPERCDAGMKRQAIEQWAAHVDLGGADSLDFYQLSERHGPMRLPWSMRSNSDLRTRHHLQWHQNPIIKGYLGERWRPRADGLEALLQERPKDYVQILILQAMERSSSGEGLRDLANAAALDPQIKDIIFADDAAHNTVFSDKPVFAEYEQPTTLAELLAQLGEDLAPQAQETIIEGQRLRIQVLEGELAAAQKAFETKAGQYEELRVAYDGMARELMLALEALRQKNEQGKNVYVPAARSQMDALMLNHGINPTVPDDVLRDIVGGIRRGHNRRLHSDVTSDPASEARLREINSELDRILESRGLGKNQG